MVLLELIVGVMVIMFLLGCCCCFFCFLFFFNHLQLQTLLYVKYIVKFTELIIKAYVRDGGGSFFLSFMWFVSSSWLNQSCMLHLTVALVSKCFFFCFFFFKRPCAKAVLLGTWFLKCVFLVFLV